MSLAGLIQVVTSQALASGYPLSFYPVRRSTGGRSLPCLAPYLERDSSVISMKEVLRMVSVEYVLRMMEEHPLYAYDDLVCRLHDWFNLSWEECEAVVDEAVTMAIDMGRL